MSIVRNLLSEECGSPLVDMEVRVQVGHESRSRRGATDGLHGEVIILCRLLLHAHVLEIEAVRSICLISLIH